MVRKPRLGVFFLIDFSILAFEFDLIMILGPGSVSVKDVQTYLYNLIEAEPEPKSNRASDTDNTDDADNTENAENAENADDTDDAMILMMLMMLMMLRMLRMLMILMMLMIL